MIEIEIPRTLNNEIESFIRDDAVKEKLETLTGLRIFER